MRVLPFCCCRRRSCPCYYCSLAALLLSPLSRPSAKPSTERTDHPVGLFTLSSTVSLLPWIVCGLKDRITRQECPLVFQSLHHLHLSTLQPISLPAKDCMFGECPYHDASQNVSQKEFSSRWQEAWAHRRFLPWLYFQPQARSRAHDSFCRLRYLPAACYAHGGFCSFRCLPAARCYNIQVLNSLLTVKMMIFSLFKDEPVGPLPQCPSSVFQTAVSNGGASAYPYRQGC